MKHLVDVLLAGAVPGTGISSGLRFLWRIGSQGDEENQLQRVQVPTWIIHQEISLYLRVTLSFRDVED
jgi:hypothetical protein